MWVTHESAEKITDENEAAHDSELNQLRAENSRLIEENQQEGDAKELIQLRAENNRLRDGECAFCAIS